MALWTPVAGEVPTAAQWADRVSRRVLIDCTSASRPGSPVEGMHIYETDTDKILVYNGAAWVELGTVGAWSSYSPTWSAGTAPSLGNGTLTGQYQRLFGRTILVRVVLTAGSTTTFGTGQWFFSMPASLTGAFGYGAFGATAYDSSATTHYAARPYVSGSSIYLHSLSSNTWISLTNTAPFTWAQSDVLDFTLIVESTT